MAVRIVYRRKGDALVLDVEGNIDERRLWKTLETFGIKVQVDTASKDLIKPRFIQASAFPKLEQACKILRAQLVAAEGEVPVEARTPRGEAWKKARPVDAAAVASAAAKEQPETAERMLHDARIRLKGFAHETPEWRAEALADAAALDQALAKVQAELQKRATEERRAVQREHSEELKGVAGEDLWRAHEALKKLRDAVTDQEHRAAVRKAVDLPERIPGFLGSLRHYQRDGVEFILGRDANAILADDMGLGKTVMTIAAVVASGDKALVVGPANVLYNWVEEVERFTGEHALVWHRQRFLGPRGARFLVTTYDALRNAPWEPRERSDRATESQQGRSGTSGAGREHAQSGRGTSEDDQGEFTSRPILVLDEAHLVRNPETQRAQLVRALPQKRRLLLTGTPLVNTVEDYYELLRQVEPSRWGSRENFRDAWLVDATLFNRYAQVRNATATLLQRAARDVMLRRKKEEVLTELPSRTISVERHELAPADEREHRRLEGALAETLRKAPTEVAVFAALTALRHHLALARVDAVLERVRELREAGENVIVYAQYLEPLRRLKAALGAEAAMLEGATPPIERQRLARTLGTDAGPKVLLAQMDAGGLGLNFTAARFVLFVHLGWTPSGHAQAIDRVHRIGQDRPVQVEFFVTPGTVDERLVRILLRKEADQNLVLADESDVLNRSELTKLLAEDAKERVEAEKAASG